MYRYVFKRIFGSYHDKYIKKLQPIVNKINSLEDEVSSLDKVALQSKTQEFFSRVENGESLDSILPEAFAVVREASKRTVQMRHFDVQLIGGCILHQGKIAEMKTGEGKTLVATLALYLNAIERKGSHLVTVNDYLAKRDALWMGAIYLYTGLSVGIIQNEGTFLVEFEDEEKFTTRAVPCSRQEAYNADITYGTNNEYGFDYLRDNMKFGLGDYVQRELNFAIVDEVDSILIDEARTPLIISGPTEVSTTYYYDVKNVVASLTDADYALDEKGRSAKLTDSGIEIVEKGLGVENLYDVANIGALHFVNNALKAHFVFKKDIDYVVNEGKVVIVDEFTGRLMDGRRYSDGLHQSIEAKEGVVIENENQTLASITFQNYFRMYNKLAGMTGTALTEAQEFSEIYKLNVVPVPTHAVMIREDSSDQIYKTFKEKYDAIIDDINEKHKIGRPVLVGTVSIETSEYISKLLQKRKIRHEVLNAKHHEREAQIIAGAGRKGAVTIATNMAGRGTDIKLGEGIADIGGLHIIGTERHESRRIDNQLRGRAGRQGDPGSSRFFLSFDDNLLRIFVSEKMSGIMEKVGMEDGEPIEHPLVTRSIENAQKRVEASHFEIRKHLLEYDDVANQQRKVIYGTRREILVPSGASKIINDYVENVVDDLIEKHFSDLDDNEGFERELKRIADVELDTEGENKRTIGALRGDIVHSIGNVIDSKRIEFGEHFDDLAQFVLLTVLDSRWKDHLLAMDHLRSSVSLRGYGQKDPLLEYKKEAYNVFSEMMHSMEVQTLHVLVHVQRKERQAVPSLSEHRRQSNTVEKKEEFGRGEDRRKPVRRAAPRVGRNDPCSCGSGRKYKHCHGVGE